ncbi:adenosylcobinamide-GDP ribazoletransferase [Tianweitania sp. BSSL-BM11]|uniref:Adenosylcobinamide-GDP ribazoletransferase n=1 Tax=Tianweitania aestuarii TaxID=2814886 RepID=A0ABS5RY21_9HYPH|nr:adenosylcobinamide-GDP ribazoletransferase [Tianweitania aestuarii]MBS9720582.1 adenosylcobinamide-GDP ribazoletransferase [Tianweitania aestuarii]
MTAGPGRDRDWMGEIFACLGFFTRLPMPAYRLAPDGFSRALWAAPLAGLVPAVAATVALSFGHAVDLPPLASAGLALVVLLLITGALHEDGLSDVADGFGGGSTRARKLEIMKDSRIGTYGVAALVLSLLLRAALLAALVPYGFGITLATLIAAHCASRGLLPYTMHTLPNAREGGVSAGVGQVPKNSAMLALLLGFFALLPLGFGHAILAAILLGLIVVSLHRLALRQIGGQTGDVLGMVQQVAEVGVLIVAVAALR